MNSVSTINKQSHENMSKSFIFDIQKKQDMTYLGMTKVEHVELKEMQDK